MATSAQPGRTLLGDALNSQQPRPDPRQPEVVVRDAVAVLDGGDARLERAPVRELLGGPAVAALHPGRAVEDRGEASLVLDSSSWIFVLDDQIRVRRVDGQQLARGELMIEPIDSAILQISQRIVTRGAGQLVLLFERRDARLENLARRQRNFELTSSHFARWPQHFTGARTSACWSRCFPTRIAESPSRPVWRWGCSELQLRSVR